MHHPSRDPIAVLAEHLAETITKARAHHGLEPSPDGLCGDVTNLSHKLDLTERDYRRLVESVDGAEKLGLLGRDRVLVDKLTKELQQSAKHPTRGPYETRRGSTFDVQGTLDDEPTGRIYRVTIELIEVEQVPS